VMVMELPVESAVAAPAEASQTVPVA
jgi:hypothetical protein